MNRHQHHTALAAVVAIEVGEQRHLLQEIRQKHLTLSAFLAACVDELLQTVHELLEVLLARDVVGVFAGKKVGRDATLADNLASQLVSIGGA